MDKLPNQSNELQSSSTSELISKNISQDNGRAEIKKPLCIYTPCKTAGGGDCAFHALFGIKNCYGEYRSNDVQGWRIKVANAIRNCKKGDPILPLIVASITEPEVKEHFADLYRMQEIEHGKINKIIVDTWDTLKTALECNEDILRFIDSEYVRIIKLKNIFVTEQDLEGEDLKVKFEYIYNNAEDGKILFNKIDSVLLTEEFNAYLEARKEVNREFHWEDQILKNKGALDRFAAEIEKMGRWTYREELGILAYVANKTVQVHVRVNSDNEDSEIVMQNGPYNPGQKETVDVFFIIKRKPNGKHEGCHYERMEKSYSMVKINEGSTNSDDDYDDDFKPEYECESSSFEDREKSGAREKENEKILLESSENQAIKENLNLCNLPENKPKGDGLYPAPMSHNEKQINSEEVKNTINPPSNEKDFKSNLKFDPNQKIKSFSEEKPEAILEKIPVQEETPNVDIGVNFLRQKISNAMSFLQVQFQEIICCEKILVRLIKSIERCEKNNSNDLENEKINEQLRAVKERLMIEKLHMGGVTQKNPDGNKGLFLKLEENIEKEKIDWVEAKKIAEKLLKKIRPFDIEETKRLIEENKDFGRSINGKEIILFLGDTGSGKSTTLLYLFGAKLIQDKEDKYKFDCDWENDPVIKKHPLLKDVRPESGGVSGTRHITAVPMDQVVFCDTPGFGDTRGAEIDAANSVNMVEAIRGCKKARILVLINYFDLAAGRFQAITSTVKKIIEMCPTISSTPWSMEVLSFAFTKVPPGDEEQIKIKIESALCALRNPDKNIRNVFNHILKKIKSNGPKIVNVNNNEEGVRRNFLDHVMENEGIEQETISDFFSFSVKKGSKADINIERQLKIHQESVINACERGEYKIVNQRLDELRDLHNMLKRADIIGAYEKCLLSIEEHLKKERYEINKIVLSWFEDNVESLSKDSIQECKRHIEAINSATSILAKHLVGNNNADPNIELEKTVINILNEIENLEISSKNLSANKSKIAMSGRRMNKVRVIIDVFGNMPEIAKAYKKACENLQLKFNSLTAELEDKKLEKIAEGMDKIDSVALSLRLHLDTYKYDDIKRLFKEKMAKILSVSDQEELNRMFDQKSMYSYTRIVERIKELIISDVKNIAANAKVFVRQIIKKNSGQNIPFKDFKEKMQRLAYIKANFKFFDSVANIDPEIKNTYEDISIALSTISEKIIEKMNHNMFSKKFLEKVDKTLGIFNQMENDDIFAEILKLETLIELPSSPSSDNVSAPLIKKQGTVISRIKVIKEFIRGYKLRFESEMSEGLRIIKNHENTIGGDAEKKLIVDAVINIKNRLIEMQQVNEARIQCLNVVSLLRDAQSLDVIAEVNLRNFVEAFEIGMDQNIDAARLAKRAFVVLELKELDELLPSGLRKFADIYEREHRIRNSSDIKEIVTRINKLLKKWNDYNDSLYCQKTIGDIVKNFRVLHLMSQGSVAGANSYSVTCENIANNLLAFGDKITCIGYESVYAKNDNKFKNTRKNMEKILRDIEGNVGQVLKLKIAQRLLNENLAKISVKNADILVCIKSLQESIFEKIGKFIDDTMEKIKKEIDNTESDHSIIKMQIETSFDIKSMANEILEEMLVISGKLSEIEMIDSIRVKVRNLSETSKNLVIGRLENLIESVEKSGIKKDFEKMVFSIKNIKSKIKSLRDILSLVANYTDKKDIEPLEERLAAILIKMQNSVIETLKCIAQESADKPKIKKEIDLTISPKEPSPEDSLIDSVLKDKIEIDGRKSTLEAISCHLEKIKTSLINEFEGSSKIKQQINITLGSLKKAILIAIEDVNEIYKVYAERLFQVNSQYKPDCGKVYRYIGSNDLIWKEVVGNIKREFIIRLESAASLSSAIAFRSRFNEIILSVQSNDPFRKEFQHDNEKALKLLCEIDTILKEADRDVVGSFAEVEKLLKRCEGMVLGFKMSVIKNAISSSLSNWLVEKYQSITKLLKTISNNVNVSEVISVLNTMGMISNIMKSYGKIGIKVNFNIVNDHFKIMKKAFRTLLTQYIDLENVDIEAAINILQNLMQNLGFYQAAKNVTQLGENLDKMVGKIYATILQRLASDQKKLQSQESFGSLDINELTKIAVTIKVGLEKVTFFNKEVLEKNKEKYRFLNDMKVDMIRKKEVVFDYTMIIKNVDKIVSDLQARILSVSFVECKNLSDLPVRLGQLENDLLSLNKLSSINDCKKIDICRDICKKHFAIQIKELSEILNDSKNGLVNLFVNNDNETIDALEKRCRSLNDYLDLLRLLSNPTNYKGIGVFIGQSVFKISEDIFSVIQKIKEQALAFKKGIFAKDRTSIKGLALCLVKMRILASEISSLRSEANIAINEVLKDFEGEQDLISLLDSELKSTLIRRYGELIIKDCDCFEICRHAVLDSSVVNRDAQDVLNGMEAGCGLYFLNELPRHELLINYGNSYIVVGNAIYWVNKRGVERNCECDNTTFTKNFEGMQNLNVGQRDQLEKDIVLNHGIAVEKNGGIDLEERKELEDTFKTFHDEYMLLLDEKNTPNGNEESAKLKRDIIIANLKEKIKEISNGVKQEAGNINWDTLIKAKAIKLLAHVFAIWTLQNGKRNKSGNYIRKPYAAQVIAIMRMLSIGSKKGIDGRELSNNLVEILTGEGKSIILAAVASVLALLGFKVSCACFSADLTKRDKERFHPLFKALGLAGTTNDPKDDRISYGTFRDVCERKIDSLRNDVKKKIHGERLDLKNGAKEESPEIFLIDEVDVFLSKFFYGQFYMPTAKFGKKDGPSKVSGLTYFMAIKGLTDLIWKKKADAGFNLNLLKKEKVYKDCCKAFDKWEFLVEGAAKKMLEDVKHFDKHKSEVKNGKIFYVEQDGTSAEVVYGYETLFAYYKAFSEGKISEENLDEYIGLQINCGNFSYAELPNLFERIIGVTGTLRDLSFEQRKILEGKYKLSKFTFMPSMFSEFKREFKTRNFKIREKGKQHFDAIKEEIQEGLVGSTDKKVKRAVLVFFESKRELEEFFKLHGGSLQAESRDSIKFLTEDMKWDDEKNTDGKKTIIEKATRSGQITLCTRSFVRGTDFECIDDKVNKNGGVHVIQTFPSDTIEEEVQARGRTSRRGEDGSFSMVVCKEDLSKFNIKNSDISAADSRDYYDLFNRKRNAKAKIDNGNLEKSAEYLEKEHKDAEQFSSDLFKNNFESVKGVRQFLRNYNGAFIPKIVVLMDATGSMGDLIDETKLKIKDVFTRVSGILCAKHIADNVFAMKLVVYRNYQNKEKILESSRWAHSIVDLQPFLEKIVSICSGSKSGEAMEVGIMKAGRKTKKGDVSAVVAIGDEPPNTVEDINREWKLAGGDKVFSDQRIFNRFAFFTPQNAHVTSETELEELRIRCIPVHAYYVVDTKRTRDAFNDIAKKTGGTSGFLNLAAKHGGEELARVIALPILEQFEKQEGLKHGTLVDEYNRQFPVNKSYLGNAL